MGTISKIGTLILVTFFLGSCSGVISSRRSCSFFVSDLGERISWKQVDLVDLYIGEDFPDQHIGDIERAADIWNQVFIENFGGPIFQIQEERGDCLDRDGRSTICWTRFWTGEANRQARAIWFSEGSEMIDGDIVINGKDFSFSRADSNPVSSKVDLVSLLIHEMGHILGLDHDEFSGSIMNYRLSQGVHRRNIGAHDIDNLSCEYK